MSRIATDLDSLIDASLAEVGGVDPLDALIDQSLAEASTAVVVPGMGATPNVAAGASGYPQQPITSLMPTGGGLPGDILRGLDRGIPIAMGQIGGAQAALGNYLPGSLGREMTREGEAFAADMAITRDRTPAPTTFLGGVAESVPGLVGAVGTGLMTGGAAPALVATAAGAGVAGIQAGGGQYNEAMQRLEARGIVGDTARDKAAASAAGTGAVSAVTSLVPMSRYLSRFVPAPVANGVMGKIASTRAGRIVMDAAAEGSQEAVEELGSMAMQQLAEDDPEAYKQFGQRIGMAFAGGAVLGGVVGGASELASRRGATPQQVGESQSRNEAADKPQIGSEAANGQEVGRLTPEISGVIPNVTRPPVPATPDVADATPDVAAPEAPTLAPETIARIETLYDELINRPDMPEAERVAMESEIARLAGDTEYAPPETQAAPASEVGDPPADQGGRVAGAADNAVALRPVGEGVAGVVAPNGMEAGALARDVGGGTDQVSGGGVADAARVNTPDIASLSEPQLRARAAELGLNSKGAIGAVRRRVQNAERAASGVATIQPRPESRSDGVSLAATDTLSTPDSSASGMAQTPAPARNRVVATSDATLGGAAPQTLPQETPRTPQTPPVAQGSASQNPTPTGSQYAISSPKGYHLTARNKSVISQMLAQGAKSANSGNTRYDIEGDGPNYTVRITTREANDRGQVQNRERATPFFATRRGSAAPSAPVPPTPAPTARPSLAQRRAASQQSRTQGGSQAAGVGAVSLDPNSSDAADFADIQRRTGGTVRAVAATTPTQKKLEERLRKLGRRVVFVEDSSGKFNGVASTRDNRTVYVRADASDADAVATTAHELLHSVAREAPDFVNKVVGFVSGARLAQAREKYRERLAASFGEDSQVVKRFDQDETLSTEESVAQLIEDAAAGDMEAARALYETPGVLQRLRQMVRKVLDKMGVVRLSSEEKALLRLLDTLEKNAEEGARRAISWANSKGGITTKLQEAYAKTPDSEYRRSARDILAEQEDLQGVNLDTMFSWPSRFGELAGEIRWMREDPVMKRLLSFGNPKGGGPLAFKTLGADKYMEIAYAEAGETNPDTAIDALQSDPDPQNQFIAAVAITAREYERTPSIRRVTDKATGKEKQVRADVAKLPPKVPFVAAALQPGDIFFVNDRPVRVLRDEDERMVLVGGPFRGIFVEGLTTIPIDANSHSREGTRRNVEAVQAMGSDATDVPSAGGSSMPLDPDVPFSPREPARTSTVFAGNRQHLVVDSPTGRDLRAMWRTLPDAQSGAPRGAKMVRYVINRSTDQLIVHDGNLLHDDFLRARPDVRRGWFGSGWLFADGTIEDYNGENEELARKGVGPRNPTFSPRSMFDRTDETKGTGAAQGSLFGIPADAVAKTPPKLSPAELRELYPGIRPGETVAKYEKRMGTADTPVMFSPLPATIEVDGVQRPTTNSNGQPIAQDEASVRNFWKWFAGSRVVDAEGRPKVVYHGTKGNFSTFDISRSGASGAAYGTPLLFASDDPQVASGYAIESFAPEVGSAKLKWEASFDRLQDVVSSLIDKVGYTDATRTIERSAKYASPQRAFAPLGDLLDAGRITRDEYDALVNAFESEESNRVSWDELTRANANTTGSNVMPMYAKVLNPRVSAGGGMNWQSVMPENVAKMTDRQDGVIVESVQDNAVDDGRISTVVAVRDANQFKSATGNLGTFDPANPDIRFAPRAANDGGVNQPLSEKQFYSKYMQHVDLRGDRAGTSAQNRESIMSNGFVSGYFNVMAPQTGGIAPGVSGSWALRKGQTVYFVPKASIKNNRIVNGWKPQPFEVATVEYDGQPAYELYSRAFSEAQRDARFAPRGMSRIEQRNQERADKVIARLEKKVETTAAKGEERAGEVAARMAKRVDTEREKAESAKAAARATISVLQTQLKAAMTREKGLSKVVGILETMRARQETRADEATAENQARAEAMKQMRATQREVEQVKDELVRAVRDALPRTQHGQFITDIRKVTIRSQFPALLSKIEKASQEYRARELKVRIGRVTGVKDTRKLASAKVRDTVVGARSGRGKLKALTESLSTRDVAKKAMSDFVASANAFMEADSNAKRQEHLAEMDAALRQLTAAVEAQKAEDKLIEKDRVRAISEVASQVVSRLSSMPAVVTMRKLGVTFGNWTNNSVLTVAGFDNIANIIDGRLDGEEGGGGTFQTVMADPIRRGQDNAANQVEDAKDLADEAAARNGLGSFAEAFATLFGSMGEANVATYKLAIPIGGRTELQAWQALKLAAMDSETLMQVLGTDRPLHWDADSPPFTVSWQQYDAMMKVIPENHLAFMQELKAIRDGGFADMAKVVKVLTGTEPPKVAGYDKITVHPDVVSKWKTDEAALAMPTGHVSASLENLGLTKARESRSAAMLVTNFGSDWLGTVDAQARVTHLATPIRNLKELLRRDTVNAAIKSRISPYALTRLNTIMDDVSGTGQRGSREGSEFTRRWLKYSANKGKALTALNIGSIARNGAGVMSLAAEMDGRTLATGMARVMSMQGDSLADLMAKSPTIRRMYGRSIVGLQQVQTQGAMASDAGRDRSGSMWNQFIRGGKAVGKSASEGVASLRFLATPGRRAGAVQDFMRGLLDAAGNAGTMLDGINFMHYVASLPARVAWEGYKAEAARRGLDESWAIAQTERTIRRTQGVPDPSELTAFQSWARGTIAQPFTMFGTDAARMANILLRAKVTGKRRGAAVTAATLVGLWSGAVTVAVSKELWQLLLGDNDEEEKWELIKRMLLKGAFDAFRDSFGGVAPGISDRAVESGKAFFTNPTPGAVADQLMDNPATSGVSNWVAGVGYLVSGAKEGIQGDDGKGKTAGEKAAKGAEILVTEMMEASGIPLPAVYRNIKKIVTAATDNK